MARAVAAASDCGAAPAQAAPQIAAGSLPRGRHHHHRHYNGMTAVAAVVVAATAVAVSVVTGTGSAAATAADTRPRWPNVETGLPPPDEPLAYPPPRDPVLPAAPPDAASAVGRAFAADEFAAAHEEGGGAAEVHVKRAHGDADCPLPAGRWLHTATYLGGSVYVFGGIDAATVAAVRAANADDDDGDDGDDGAASHRQLLADGRLLSRDPADYLLNDVWSYNLAPGYWRGVAADTTPCVGEVLSGARRRAALDSLPAYRPATVPAGPRMRAAPGEAAAAADLPPGAVPPAFDVMWPDDAAAAAAHAIREAGMELAPASADTAASLAGGYNGDVPLAAPRPDGTPLPRSGEVPAPRPGVLPFLHATAPSSAASAAAASGSSVGKTSAGKSSVKRGALLETGSGDGGGGSSTPRTDRYRHVLGLDVPELALLETNTASAGARGGGGGGGGGGDAVRHNWRASGVYDGDDVDDDEAGVPVPLPAGVGRDVADAAADALDGSGHEAYLYTGTARTVRHPVTGLLAPAVDRSALDPGTAFDGSPPSLAAGSVRDVVYTPADALWQWDLASQAWFQPASAPRPTVAVPVALVQSGALVAQPREGYSLGSVTLESAMTPPAASTTGGTGGTAGSGAATAARLELLPREVQQPAPPAVAAQKAGQSAAKGAGTKSAGTPTPPPTQPGGDGSGADPAYGAGARAPPLLNPDAQYPSLDPAPRPLNAPTPRWLHSAVAMGRGLVVFGGVATADFRVLADAWYFDPEPAQPLAAGVSPPSAASLNSAGAKGGAGGGSTAAPQLLPFSQPMKGRVWRRVWPLEAPADKDAAGLELHNAAGVDAASRPAVDDPTAPRDFMDALGVKAGAATPPPGASTGARPSGTATAAAASGAPAASQAPPPPRSPPPLEGHSAVVVRIAGGGAPLPSRGGPAAAAPAAGAAKATAGSTSKPTTGGGAAGSERPPAGTSEGGVGEVMLVYGGLRADGRVLGGMRDLDGVPPSGGASSSSLFGATGGFDGAVWALSLAPSPSWQLHLPPSPAPGAATITPVAPPSRWLHSAAVVRLAGADVMVVFGGCGADMRPLNDVWLYDYGGNAWREVAAHGYGPAPRWLAALTAIRSPPLPLSTTSMAGSAAAPAPDPASYYAAAEADLHPEKALTLSAAALAAAASGANDATGELAGRLREQRAALDAAARGAASGAAPASATRGSKSAAAMEGGKFLRFQRALAAGGGKFPSLGSAVSGLTSTASSAVSGLASTASGAAAGAMTAVKGVASSATSALSTGLSSVVSTVSNNAGLVGGILGGLGALAGWGWRCPPCNASRRRPRVLHCSQRWRRGMWAHRDHWCRRTPTRMTTSWTW